MKNERMKGLPRRLHDWLPWNRPRLCDLPIEERRRIKAMMLGAGAGCAMKPDADGKIRIEHIHVGSAPREQKGEMRDRQKERAMLAEVYLRNLIAKYRDLNESDCGEAVTPEVGIFWMSGDGEIFFKQAISIRDAVSYDQFRTFEGSHYEEWDAAVRATPQWAGMEYEEVPRGRVVLCIVPGRSRFIVYLPKQLRGHEAIIARTFLLPPGHTDFDYTDEHYRL
jgi:hypothetical protein